MDSSAVPNAVTLNLKVAKVRALIHVEDDVSDFERLRLNNVFVLDFFFFGNFASRDLPRVLSYFV